MLGRGKDRHPASLPAVISLPGAPVIWSETRGGCRGLVLTQARGPPITPKLQPAVDTGGHAAHLLHVLQFLSV